MKSFEMMRPKDEYGHILQQREFNGNTDSVLKNFQVFIAKNRLSSHMLVIAQKDEVTT